MAYVALGLLLVLIAWLYFQVRRLRRDVEDLRRQIQPPPLPVERAPEPPVLPAAPSESGSRWRAAWQTRAATTSTWEATIGGSWLNRLGVLILIIGVALFLGYSLTQFGPAGKIVVGYAVAACLLVSGLALEKRPAYTNFARGLIAGGWAALYFTTFALHGVPAARVIESGALAMALLLAVSLAMIAYSLRYGSEVVTGLAYAIAFVTLQIGPVSEYSLAASVPLAASLVIIARRMQWSGIVAAGLVLTYATFGVQYTASVEQHAWLRGQPLLWIYWILFEAFDIVQQKSARQAVPAARALFGLNAAGLIGTSLLTSSPATAPSSWMFLLTAALAYLASTFVRAHVLGERETTAPAILGAYEPAITLSAALFAGTILKRLDGTRINIGLLLEGEFLALASLYLGRKYFRYLGAGIFALPLLKLLLYDIAGPLRSWTPIGIVTAAVFYANRLIFRSDWYYSYAASLVAAIVIAYEAPHEYIGVAWLVMAACLWTIGWRDLQVQGFALAVASFFALLVFDLAAPHSAATRISFGASAAILFGAAWKSTASARNIALGAASFYAAVFLWHALPADLVVFAWALFGIGMLYAGVRLEIGGLKWQSCVLALATFGRAWIVNFEDASRLATGVFAAAAFYIQRQMTLNTRLSAFFSALGSGLVLVLIFEEVSGKMLTIACGIEGIALLAAGFALRGRDLRLSGLVLFFLCIAKLFFYDLRQLDTLSRIVSFIGLGLLLVGASWAYTRFRGEIRKLL